MKLIRSLYFRDEATEINVCVISELTYLLCGRLAIVSAQLNRITSRFFKLRYPQWRNCFSLRIYQLTRLPMAQRAVYEAYQRLFFGEAVSEIDVCVISKLTYLLRERIAIDFV